MRKPKSNTPRFDAYWKQYMALCAQANESMEWITHNLSDVEFPPLGLYLVNSDTKVWVSNDTLLGELRFTDWECRFGKNPPTRLGDVKELSKASVATLHDHMVEHWNNPASVGIRAAKENIRALMENPDGAGEHPTVKAITAMVEDIQ